MNKEKERKREKIENEAMTNLLKTRMQIESVKPDRNCFLGTNKH